MAAESPLIPGASGGSMANQSPGLLFMIPPSAKIVVAVT
jgi:hypothetical protein